VPALAAAVVGQVTGVEPMPSECDSGIVIEEAGSSRTDIVRDLFREYQRSVDAPVCFEDFERELEGLPGEYTPPMGGLFLALDNTEPVGCVGLRPQGTATAEVKRLFVRKSCRRSGIGAHLMTAVITYAGHAGITELILETLPSMRAAICLYQQLGFVPEPAYHHPTAPGAQLLIKRLSPPA